jgi:hypothetical protein
VPWVVIQHRGYGDEQKSSTGRTDTRTVYAASGIQDDSLRCTVS